MKLWRLSTRWAKYNKKFDGANVETPHLEKVDTCFEYKMKKLKKSVVLLSIASTMMFGCTSSKSSLGDQPIKIQEFKRDEYVVLDKAYGEAKSFRFWLLFLPLGGKSDQKLYEIAYSKAIKSAVGQEADGLLQPRYTYKKTAIPLLLIGFTTKKVTAEGKAFRIKTEEEYQKTKEKD